MLGANCTDNPDPQVKLSTTKPLLKDYAKSIWRFVIASVVCNKSIHSQRTKVYGSWPLKNSTMEEGDIERILKLTKGDKEKILKLTKRYRTCPWRYKGLTFTLLALLSLSHSSQWQRRCPCPSSLSFTYS